LLDLAILWGEEEQYNRTYFVIMWSVNMRMKASKIQIKQNRTGYTTAIILLFNKEWNEKRRQPRDM
jgi:hypothetical protein